LHNFEDQQTTAEVYAASEAEKAKNAEKAEEAKTGNPPSSSGDFIMTDPKVISD